MLLKTIKHLICRKILLTAATIFLLFVNLKAQNQPFQFRVNFTEFTNLTYQIECLNDQIYCHKEDFEALWTKEFLQTDEDQKLLASWKNVREHYQQSFEIETDLQFPLERRAGRIDLSNKLTIAGLQAKDLEDYSTRLDLLVVPREREEFVKVVRHFAPRFAVWWKREAGEKGAAFAGKIETLLADETLKKSVGKFYNFYQPDLPENYVVTFDLIFRPDLVKSGSSGFSLENHQPVEFFFDEDPKQRIDVVIHELCHFMYYSVAPEKHVALQDLFLKSGRATAIPAYNLLDETFASALGNGIIRRSYAKPENWQKYFAKEASFYSNPNIDRAGKAMLPVLDEWLAKDGRLIDEAFVRIYLDTLEKSFGERLTAPQFQLSQVYAFFDDKFDRSLRNYFRRTMNVASFYGETNDLSKAELKDLTANPSINAAFIIQPQSLNQLAAKKIVTETDFKAMQKIYKAEKQVLFGVKRNVNSYIFIIVAEKDETAKTIIKNLADAPKIFVGKFGQISK